MMTDRELEIGSRIRFHQAGHPWDGLEGQVEDLPRLKGKFHSHHAEIVLFGTFPSNPRKGYKCYPRRDELEILEEKRWETAPCGCTVTKGYRCLMHHGP